MRDNYVASHEARSHNMTYKLLTQPTGHSQPSGTLSVPRYHIMVFHVLEPSQTGYIVESEDLENFLKAKFWPRYPGYDFEVEVGEPNHLEGYPANMRST